MTMTTTPDGLEYNSAGYLKSPKPGDGPWGICSLVFALVYPVAVLLDKWSSPIPGTLLKKTILFQVALERHFLSEKQIGNAEFLLVCQLLLLLCGIPAYFKKNAGKYSYQSPPPLPLRRLWPRQIRLLIAVGIGFVCLPVIFSWLVHWGAPAEILAPKHSMFMVLVLLSEGVYFTAEGSVCGLLYGYFYFKYWRRSD
jgi:hypothetical protein